MQYNNGLKFSFSLHSHTPTSLHSTPKFPSIEIEQQMKTNKPKQSPAIKQERRILNFSQSPNQKEKMVRPQSKSKRILQKYAHLTLITQRQKPEKDSKSVRSIQSSKSYKYYRSKTQTSNSLTKSSKNRHSSVSSTNLNTYYHSLKARIKPASYAKEPRKIQLIVEPYRQRLFQQKNGEKLTNNYIEPSKTAKQRISKQIIPIFQQSSNHHEIADRNKSFKSKLNKARPVLRIGGRLLSNNRLQQMSKPPQIYEEFNQF